MSGLRPNAINPGFEVAKGCTAAAIACDLMVDIADKAQVSLVVDEVGGAEVQVGIDAVLIVDIGVFPVVRQARHGGKLIRLVKVRVAASRIQSSMTQADVD
ncbi:hypothetical protein D3C73_1321280 [compost metagenome]